MIHKNYRDMFVFDLKANASDFDNEYEIVIKEYGQSNETKLDFYNAAFNSVISNLKKETPIRFSQN